MKTSSNFIITSVCTFMVIFVLGAIATVVSSLATEQGAAEKLSKVTYHNKIS